MSEELLGLPLDWALALQKQRGIIPQVRQTHAPKRQEQAGGQLRVVQVSAEGQLLTVARFFDPAASPSRTDGEARKA